MIIQTSLKFEKDLYDLINNCGLPIDTAFYILKSVYLDFQQTLMDCAKTEGETFSEEEIKYNLDPDDCKNMPFKEKEKVNNEQPVD